MKDIIAKARTYRRFQEDAPVGMDLLTGIVDAVRLVPSAANQQPLRYAVSTSREMNAKIFPNLGWAAALKDWNGPAEGERPAAYIVIAGDAANDKNHKVDMGIAAQTINLELVEAGLGACMLANINAKAIHAAMGLPESVVVLLVMAIGKPVEKVVVDVPAPDGGLTYWREADGTHHVPKRPLDQVLLAKFE